MKKIIVLTDKRLYHGYEVNRDDSWVKLKWIDRGVHSTMLIPTWMIAEEIEDKGPELKTEQGEEKVVVSDDDKAAN